MKRLWSLLLVLLLIPCLVTAASAAETSGKCGEDLTWVYDSGEKTLTISGTGGMEDYAGYGDIPWADICKNFDTLVIEEGVTGIGDRAFAKCTALETVSLPQSLTEIGDYAFYDSGSIFKLTIPAGVTRIGKYAFAEIDLLSFINLPEGLEKIPEGLFKNCNMLNKIQIPASVTEIGKDAFLNCYDLQAYTVAEGNTAYSSQNGVLFNKDGTELLLFPSCYAKKTYQIPATVTDIASGAFNYCATLREVKLSAGITELKSGTFTDMDYLYLHLTSGLQKIQENAVGKVRFVFRVYVKDIMDWVRLFEENPDCDLFGSAKSTIYLYVNGSTFTKLNLPATLTKIPAWTFAHCEVKGRIPDTVTEIGHHAFYDSSVTEVVIPDSVTQMGKYAFANCWDISSVQLSRNLKEIPAYCFYISYNDSGMDKLVLPDKLEKIGDYAFYGNADLDKLYMPATVKEIGSKVFYKCDALADVYYSGTAAQRKKIDNSSSTGNAKWHYAYIQKPTIEVVTGDTEKPIVRWDRCSYATSYRIYRRTGTSGEYKLIAKTTKLKYRDASAQAGKTYYYKVKAVDGNAESTSGYSNVVKHFCVLPEPVVKIRVDAATGKPKLTWEKIPGAKEYRVGRGGYNYFTESFKVKGTTFLDETAEPGQRYWYYVEAVCENDDASTRTWYDIDRVCDLPRPAVKIYLKDGSPRIKWAAIDGAEKYMIYRSTSENGEYTHIKTTKTATAWTDTTAEAGTTYYYKVKAIHKTNGADSAFSLVKSIEAE